MTQVFLELGELGLDIRMDAVFELVHGYFSSYCDSLLSQSVGQDCPASTARCAYRIPCLEPAIVLDAVSEAESLASPANETTAVEVSYKVEQVADWCFDE
jgi:hypothetical protein